MDLFEEMHTLGCECRLCGIENWQATVQRHHPTTGEPITIAEGLGAFVGSIVVVPGWASEEDFRRARDDRTLYVIDEGQWIKIS